MLAYLHMSPSKGECAERELRKGQRSQFQMSPLNDLSFPSGGLTYGKSVGHLASVQGEGV